MNKSVRLWEGLVAGVESLQKSLHRFKPACTITKLHLKLILSNILFLQISMKHIFLYDHDTSGHNLS